MEKLKLKNGSELKIKTEINKFEHFSNKEKKALLKCIESEIFKKDGLVKSKYAGSIQLNLYYELVESIQNLKDLERK